MKWTRTRFIKWFLFYYFISFVITFSIFEGGNLLTTFKTVKEEKSNTKITNHKLCENIESVNSFNETIQIKFNEKLRFTPEEAILHFSLSTSWEGQKIFFPPGTANITKHENNVLEISFYLPVYDAYKAKLQCSDPSSFDVQSPTELNIIKEFPKIKLETVTLTNESLFSRLRCHGKDYLTRWCEGKNIPYFDDNFFFLSPAIFAFPEPFLVPGPRAPPFDKDVDRLVSEPIVIQFNTQNLPRRLDVINSSIMSYLYGTFHNYYMLWHTMFDFIVPFYRFTHTINATDTPDNRVIYVKSDGVWMFFSLMKVISSTPIKIINDAPNGMLFPHLTMGCIKFEKDISLSRTYDQSIGFEYNFDEMSAPGLRNELLTRMGISTTNVGENGKPLIVIIDRGMTKRNIQNQKEVEDFVRNSCPFCVVKSLQLETVDVDKQVEIISRASVLLGLHGSGLTNCMWMAASRPNHTTHLIELMPYNYSCRPWYHTAANVSRVNYYEIMNKEPNWKEARSLGHCWKSKSQCTTLGCHDLLRDQLFSVEISTLNETLAPIIEQLKNTIPVPSASPT